MTKICLWSFSDKHTVGTEPGAEPQNQLSARETWTSNLATAATCLRWRRRRQIKWRLWRVCRATAAGTCRVSWYCCCFREHHVREPTSPPPAWHFSSKVQTDLFNRKKCILTYWISETGIWPHVRYQAEYSFHSWRNIICELTQWN